MPALTSETVRTLSRFRGQAAPSPRATSMSTAAAFRVTRTTCTSSRAPATGRAEPRQKRASVGARRPRQDRAPRARRHRSIACARCRDVLVQRGGLLGGDRAAGASVEPGRHRVRAPRAPARVGARRVRALLSAARGQPAGAGVRRRARRADRAHRRVRCGRRGAAPASPSRGGGRIPPVPGRALRSPRSRRSSGDRGGDHRVASSLSARAPRRSHLAVGASERRPSCVAPRSMSSARWNVKKEQALVRQLRDAVGAGRRGVGGLDQTLHALAERRVELLLGVAGLSGTRDGTAARAATSAKLGRRCPLCSEPMDQTSDVVEHAIEHAVTHIVSCRGVCGERGSRRARRDRCPPPLLSHPLSARRPSTVAPRRRRHRRHQVPRVCLSIDGRCRRGTDADTQGCGQPHDTVAAVVEALAANAGGRIAAVGVGAPGLVDRDGVLRAAPNLIGVTEMPIREHARRAARRSR